MGELSKSDMGKQSKLNQAWANILNKTLLNI